MLTLTFSLKHAEVYLHREVDVDSCFCFFKNNIYGIYIVYYHSPLMMAFLSSLTYENKDI